MTLTFSKALSLSLWSDNSKNCENDGQNCQTALRKPEIDFPMDNDPGCVFVAVEFFNAIIFIDGSGRGM